MISWNFDQGRGGEGLPLVSGEEGAFQGEGDRLLLLFFFLPKVPHPSLLVYPCKVSKVIILWLISQSKR